MTTLAPVQQQYGGGLVYLDRKHEVWHEHDEGDWSLAYFEVELPSGYNRWSQDPAEAARRFGAWMNGPVKAEYERAIKNWAVMKEEDGEVPTTRPLLNPGMFMSPEPGRQDFRRFYFAARFKRIRPQILPIESVEALVQNSGDTEEMFRSFFEQMNGFREGVVNAAHLEQQAQQNATAPAKALLEAREIERLDYLLTHRVTR